MLLNMLIPLILHVGGGMKNIPKLREKKTNLYLMFLFCKIERSLRKNKFPKVTKIDEMFRFNLTFFILTERIFFKWERGQNN